MKHYELLFILKPTLDAEELKVRVDFVKDILTKNGAEIKTVNELGARKLAYEIEKNERGYYFDVYMQIDPSAIDEILRNLRLDESILKFLNIKFETKKEVSHWEKLSLGIAKKAPPRRREEAPREIKKEEVAPKATTASTDSKE